ncbi:MAG: PLP-dependent aspartate aminotransferase family protein [Sandaracinaceae bacterium]|nr:PLP-dependent aspartate aminotransferase family protein [Sandaracinaceae bacterium]
MAAVHGCVAAFASAGDHVVAPRGIYCGDGAPPARALRALRRRDHLRGGDGSRGDRGGHAALHADRLRGDAGQPLAGHHGSGGRRARRARGRRAADRGLDLRDALPPAPARARRGSVLHSATKALCGHGDAIGGVVAGSAGDVERVREERRAHLRRRALPLSSMLIARGVRTLALRMERASASALELARRLSEHPRVERVSYPGLASHPGHAVAARQMRRGFGALVALEVVGGLAAGARAYDAVEIIARAVSLGDVRSLLTHPASTTHASLSPEQRREGGVGEG